MTGAILYCPRDVRFEERAAPAIIEATDAIIRISATCVCGSDLCLAVTEETGYCAYRRGNEDHTSGRCRGHSAC